LIATFSAVHKYFESYAQVCIMWWTLNISASSIHYGIVHCYLITANKNDAETHISCFWNSVMLKDGIRWRNSISKNCSTISTCSNKQSVCRIVCNNSLVLPWFRFSVKSILSILATTNLAQHSAVFYRQVTFVVYLNLLDKVKVTEYTITCHFQVILILIEPNYIITK